MNLVAQHGPMPAHSVGRAKPSTAGVVIRMVTVLLAVLVGVPPSSATAGVRAFTYDHPTYALVDIHAYEAPGTSPVQASGPREPAVSLSVVGRGTSTTSTRAFIATNTARLNLPFRDAGLRSQVDDVVRHFDEFGTPPTGVAQGGLKGHPTGTYGGQGLPQKPLGYYTESDVWVSGGGVKRGAERLVFGQGGEVYYTPTHYDDFVRIR